MSQDKNRVIVFDTTLRDGEQSPGASMNIEEKLQVARQLARLNIDVIEAGFPIASDGDFEAVKRVASEIKGGPSIAGLARAVNADVDRAGEALKGAEKPRIHTFIATSDVHLEHKLRMTREEVLERAVAAVKRAKQYCDDVEFSPEDASRSDIDYLCAVVEAVIEAGAGTVNIPDTVGYSTPQEFGALIGALKSRVPNIDRAVISVHCHNDLGLAVANTLSALQNGARQVECTINGIGERAGNAALEEIVMALRTRPDLYSLSTDIVTEEITRTSRMVSEITGMVVQPNKAIVGANAFAHEAGIHQHGILANRRTYEIMTPESVGIREHKLVLGKHSGRHAFDQRLKQMGYELSKEDLDRSFRRFKELADKKKDVYDEDLEAIVSDETHSIPEIYALQHLNVMSSLDGLPAASIRLKNGDTTKQAAAIGVGCVDSVYKTIDEMIDEEHKLVDYVVRAVTGGTDSIAEVTVKVSDGSNIYTGRAATLDVVLSSARAYLQAINKLVYYQQKRTGKREGGTV
ncbi:MAG: 2-isopropylmalate synthase [Armatimonadetes bacterium]|nr:2-isopropylmalate synthase [Armatimonadota bacterium]